jgi:integrase
MSIEVRTNRSRDGKPYKTYRVRYLDGGKHRSETFRRLQDAKAFEGRVIDRKNSGQGIPTRGRQMTVRELGQKWFETEVIANYSRKVQIETAAIWDRFVLPEFGDHRLRELSPERVGEWVLDLATLTGGEMQRKAIYALQHALDYAVRMQWIAHNNVLAIKKPKAATAPPKKYPPSPRQVELMRRVLLEHDHLRDATILSVLAYAGLRPGECLALRWSDVGRKTISVSRGLSLGEEKDTKNHLNRIVRLLDPVREDLDAWREFSSGDGDALIFPRRDGWPWKDEDYRNWRSRVFYEARAACAKEAAFTKLPTPYNLRTAFVSLLLHAQENPVVVAQEAGHNVATLFKHYAQVIEDLKGEPPVEPTQAIRAARLPSSCPKSNVTTRYRNTKVRRLQVKTTNLPS